MAWRAIQDSVGESETLAELSDVAERIYWRLLAHSDPWGRLDARPRKLRARCYPMLTHITNEIAASALLELEHVGRIVVWEHRGDNVIQIVDFEENQPREAFRKRPSKSRFPDPPSTLKPTEGLIDALFSSHNGSLKTTPPVAGDSGSDPDTIRSASGTEPEEDRPRGDGDGEGEREGERDGEKTEGRKEGASDRKSTTDDLEPAGEIIAETLAQLRAGGDAA